MNSSGLVGGAGYREIHFFGQDVRCVRERYGNFQGVVAGSQWYWSVPRDKIGCAGKDHKATLINGESGNLAVVFDSYDGAITRRQQMHIAIVLNEAIYGWGVGMR